IKAWSTKYALRRTTSKSPPARNASSSSMTSEWETSNWDRATVCSPSREPWYGSRRESGGGPPQTWAPSRLLHHYRGRQHHRQERQDQVRCALLAVPRSARITHLLNATSEESTHVARGKDHHRRGRRSGPGMLDRRADCRRRRPGRFARTFRHVHARPC